MLIVLIHNDGTGTQTSANYDVEVRVNRDIIAKVRVTRHNRDHGWPTLLRQIADAAEAQPRHRDGT